MTTTQERAAADAAAAAEAEQLPTGVRRVVPGALGVGVLLVSALVVVAGWHLTQGTSAVGVSDLLGLLTSPGADGAERTLDVLSASRLPRMLAGLLVGFALGVAGAMFQSLARNALASPDTLAVNAGAYFAVALSSVLGVSLPLLVSGGTAFLGGLAAAGLVLALAGRGGASTTRLILAGTVLGLALSALTSMLLVLFAQETTGLFAWGSGSLSQLGPAAVRQMAPVILLALAAGLLLCSRLDIVGLGDDTAGVLGVPVRSTRVLGTLIAVVLSAAAVTLAGPIGFVGLCAPAAARLLGGVVPALRRHLVLLPASGLLGALLVLLSDAMLRAFLGAEAALIVPTGVTTTLLGAVVLVVLARSARDAGPTRRPPTGAIAGRSRLRFWIVTGLAGVLAATAGVVGLLAGYTWLLTGDLVNWARGNALPLVEFAIDERSPRVVAALVAGAALALAGTVIQAVCRNPLAEPGIVGITGGAGVGAVVVVTGVGLASTTAVLGAAVAGALIAFAIVYGLAWRNGLDSDRLVLVGIGFSAGATALTTYLLVRSNPYDTPTIFTWLSGTTYGRTWEQVRPVVVLLVVLLPLVWAASRVLDLVALDEDTPRLVGVRLEPARLGLLLAAALLIAGSVSAVGVVGFVGLVAPHAARALVGGSHLRVVPVAMLLGAVLLSVADTVGRTVIAPAQVPAGLVVAIIGAPYFLWLLSRSRA